MKKFNKMYSLRYFLSPTKPLKNSKKPLKIWKNIENWLNFKELSLAPTKCVPIIFTRKRKYNKDIKIKIGGKLREFQDRARYFF